MIGFEYHDNEIQKELKGLSQELQTKAIRSGLTRAAGPIKKSMKANISDRTGQTSKSVNQLLLNARKLNRIGLDPDAEIAILVGPNKKVSGKYVGYRALFLEEGTESHEISLSHGKRGRAFRLSKSTNDVSNFYFVKGSVSHPGAKAKPFMQPALEANRAKIEPLFYKGLAARIDRLRSS